jgi:hypothetical protein
MHSATLTDHGGKLIFLTAISIDTVVYINTHTHIKKAGKNIALLGSQLWERIKVLLILDKKYFDCLNILFFQFCLFERLLHDCCS